MNGFDGAGTLKAMRELFDLEYTTDDRVRIAKQARNVWRFVWRDELGMWDYGIEHYRTRRLLLDTFDRFVATTFGEVAA